MLLSGMYIFRGWVRATAFPEVATVFASRSLDISAQKAVASLVSVGIVIQPNGQRQQSCFPDLSRGFSMATVCEVSLRDLRARLDVIDDPRLLARLQSQGWSIDDAGSVSSRIVASRNYGLFAVEGERVDLI